MNKLVKYGFSAIIVISTILLATNPIPVRAATGSNTAIDPALLAEYEIMAEYIFYAPKLPTKKIKGTEADILALQNLILADWGTTTYAQSLPNLSKASIEMFNQTPLFVRSVEQGATGSGSRLLRIYEPKFHKGNLYASVKVKSKDNKNRRSTDTMIFIKENGLWKIDAIQGIRKLVLAELRKRR
jgi:hypothetical protein